MFATVANIPDPIAICGARVAVHQHVAIPHGRLTWGQALNSPEIGSEGEPWSYLACVAVVLGKLRSELGIWATRQKPVCS